MLPTDLIAFYNATIRLPTCLHPFFMRHQITLTFGLRPIEAADANYEFTMIQLALAVDLWMYVLIGRKYIFNFAYYFVNVLHQPICSKQKAQILA